MTWGLMGNNFLMTRGSRKKCRLLRIFLIGNQMVLDHWFIWGGGGLGLGFHLI